MTPEIYLDVAFAELDRRRAELVNNFPVFRELIEIWGEDKTYVLESYEVILIFYNVLKPADLIKEIHHKMRKAGFKAGYLNKSTLIWNWNKNSTYVEIHINLDENSSCRKVKVGETTYPKYEIVCDSPIEEPV